MTDPASSPVPGSQPDILRLDELLTSALNQTLDGLPVEGRIEAQILMPPKEKLAIRLVPLEALERLRESESDTSLLDASFWALIGALLGVALNIPVTATWPTAGGWIVISALAAACAAVLLVRARFVRRSKRIRDDFYGTEPKK